jgi:hypothetical protein
VLPPVWLIRHHGGDRRSHTTASDPPPVLWRERSPRAIPD